jgi:hypothetical protein
MRLTFKEIVERIEHKRDIVLGLIFRENSGAAMKELDPNID